MARSLQLELAGRQLGDSGVIDLGGDHIGDWHWSPLFEGIWYGVGMQDISSFGKLAESLVLGRVEANTKYATARVGEIFKVGPTHDLIGYKAGGAKPSQPRGAFAFYPYDLRKATSDLSLYDTDSETQLAVTLQPTHYGTPAPGMGLAAELRRAEQTDLFYKREMRWTSQKALVARTDKLMMGGRAWTGLRHDDEAVKFGFAVWANSIYGFISHWMQAGRQQQGRSVASGNWPALTLRKRTSGSAARPSCAGVLGC